MTAQSAYDKAERLITDVINAERDYLHLGYFNGFETLDTIPDMIEKATSLKTLFIFDTLIIDISILAKLKNLKHLKMSANSQVDWSGLTEVAPLSSLEIVGATNFDQRYLSKQNSIESLNLINVGLSGELNLGSNRDIQSINVSRNKLESVDSIARNKIVSAINISSNQISNVDFLQNCKKIRYIDVSTHPITKIPSLADCKSITYLSLARTSIRDLDSISTNYSLKTLDISSSIVTELRAIKSHNLSTIDISNTKIFDLSPLSRHSRLSELSAASTDISNIEPLSQLQYLRRINISKTNVLNLAPVAKLNRLHSTPRNGGLEFQDTPATKHSRELNRISKLKGQRERAFALFRFLDTSSEQNFEVNGLFDSQIDQKDDTNKNFAFISYSHNDVERVSAIAEFLRSQGIPLWYDRELNPGDRWREVIGKKINDASAILTFWTSSSVVSSAVTVEADIAQKARKLVHTKLEAVNVPFGFSETQYVDLSSWDGTAHHPSMAKLLQALRDKLSNVGLETVAERMLAASPVAFVAQKGRLTPKDTPPNVSPLIINPADRVARLEGLNQSVTNLIEKAGDYQTYQLPRDFFHSLNWIKSVLNNDSLSWYALDDSRLSLIDCMTFHEASESWNRSIVSDCSRICQRIEEIRPLLQPEQIPLDQPNAKPAVTDPLIFDSQLPDVKGIAEKVGAVISTEEAVSVIDENASRYVEEIIKNAEQIELIFDKNRRMHSARGIVTKLVYAIGGILSAIGVGVTINLLTSPEAARTLAESLQPIFRSLIKFFL